MGASDARSEGVFVVDTTGKEQTIMRCYLFRWLSGMTQDHDNNMNNRYS